MPFGLVYRLAVAWLKARWTQVKMGAVWLYLKWLRWRLTRVQKKTGQDNRID